MRSLFLMFAAIIIGLLSFSCQHLPKLNADSEPPKVSQNINQEKPRDSSANWEEYKSLLFVDQSLEEMVKTHDKPDDVFAQAHKYVGEGKPEEAKRVLKRSLNDPEQEVRFRLWIWNALRQLGEKPPPKIADEVQGVVLEIPIENYIDTLAAYSDGRARYVNTQGKGGAIIWETTEESRITALVRDLIDAAEPLVGKATLIARHRPTEPHVIRVSILTYGGLRMIEVRQDSDLSNDPALTALLDAGTKLFHALLDEHEKAKQKR